MLPMTTLTTIISGVTATALLLGVWAILRRQKRGSFVVHEELTLEQVLTAGEAATRKVQPGQKLYAVRMEISKIPVDIMPPEKTQGAKEAVMIVISDAEGTPITVEAVLLAASFEPSLSEALQEGEGAIEFVK